MAWVFPIQFGNSNRPDLNQITNSLLNQMGDAFTNEVGSLVWIQCRAMAELVNTIWITNQKMTNQFNPNKMSDMLARWEAIFQIIPQPTDTLVTRRNRVAEYFFRINQSPDLSNIEAILSFLLPQTFVDLVINPVEDSQSGFIGGGPIVGGQFCSFTPWHSTLSEITVEVQKPATMSLNAFDGNVDQIYSILKQSLPAYTDFDWMYNSFTDNGTVPGQQGLITITSGSNILTGTNTSWKTPVNVLDNTYNVEAGSVLEGWDDNGVWRRMTVILVYSDTSVQLEAPVTFDITAKPYYIQGFFLDCDSSLYPYPPTCYNLDNSGINND